MSDVRAWVDEVSAEWEDPTSEGLLTMDGFDDCIVGIVQRFNDTFVLYDYAKVILKLMQRDGMTEEEADEFWDFNQRGGWNGQHTVGFLFLPPDDEDENKPESQSIEKQ